MNRKLYISVALVIALLLAPSAALAQVDVTTPGNLLALLPSSGLASSTENFVGGGIGNSVNNFVNTATVDDGLTFLDDDTNQRLAITGFNSALRNIRLFSDPGDTGRVPSSLTVYYSTLSTTSLTSSDSNYTGANGGVLVPTMALSAASFNHPIAGANASYLELFVNSPAGTQTLLFELGAAVGIGDRVSEVQAFPVPEPTTSCLVAAASLWFLRRTPRLARHGRLRKLVGRKW